MANNRLTRIWTPEEWQAVLQRWAKYGMAERQRDGTYEPIELGWIAAQAVKRATDAGCRQDPKIPADSTFTLPDVP